MDLSKLEGKPFYGKARTQFLAHKDSIQAAIQQGYPLTVIWEIMRDDRQFDAKYIQFVRYVNSVIYSKNAKQVPKGKPDLKKTTTNKIKFDHESTKAKDLDVSPSSASTIDPNRPKRAPVDMPKPMKWNPVPLTDEEIRTGIITSR